MVSPTFFTFIYWLIVQNFSERTRDREVIVHFQVPDCSSEDLREGSKLYEKAMSATKVVIVKLYTLSDLSDFIF